MKLTADPDWWKNLFDEIYLQTDSRSVCNLEVTRKEVDLICRLLPMRTQDRILDLCGGHGRHSLELSARGYRSCTVLDYSPYLIDQARKESRLRDAGLHCIQSDARSTGLRAGSFDHVLILGNSLGYIQEPDADRLIMAEAYRVLRPCGWILVDVTDGSKVKARFNPCAWHEVGEDLVVCRMRHLQGRVACTREMVLSKTKGLVRDCTYALRLFEPQDLEELLASAGFEKISLHTDFSTSRGGEDLGFMNFRVIATGRKKSEKR